MSPLPRRTAALLAALQAALLVAPGCGPATGEPVEEVRHGGKTWILPANVSHSRGVEGGVVLLWPRVIPSSDLARMRPLAKELQARLAELVATALPDRPIDRRPEPERVCPPNGCLGASVGVLLAVRGGNCLAVVVASAPELAPQRLVPWAASVAVESPIAFRAHPEDHVTVRDFIPCDALLAATATNDPAVLDALRALAAER